MADVESSDGLSEAEVLGMAISSFSMRVEYARTRLKGLMTPPRELLGRIRWLFLLGAVTIAAASAPLLVISPDMGEPYLLAGGTALALLSYGYVRQYQRESTSLPREAVQVLLLVVFGLTVGPNDITTLFYISLCFFNLYGGTVRKSVARTLLYLGAYLAATAMSPGASIFSLACLADIPGFAIWASLTYLVGLSLIRHAHALARERLLRTTGSALEAAANRAAILATAASALRTLLDGRPHTRIYIALESVDVVTIVTAEGEGAAALLGRTVDLARIPAQIRPRLVAGQALDLASPSAAFLEDLGIPGRSGALLLHPVVLEGQLRGVIAIMSDSGFPEELRDSLAMLSSQITLALESQTLREHLRHSEERFRSLVQHSSDIVTIVDAGTAIQYQTPSIERICGYGPTELLGQAFPALIHEDDLPQARAFFAELGAHPRASATIEWRYRHRDGVWLQLETTGTNLLDDAAVQGIVLNSRDISVHKQLEARLTEQALRDALTGLANHRALLAALDQEVERSQRFQHPCAVLFLDLDHFKALNDGYGHQAGDAALRAFGEVAAAALRATDTLGRWGGEEFVALLPETEAAAALTAAERVRAAVADLTLEACAGAQITCSIGVAVYPADARDVDGLVTAADRAMYAAKGLGRNQVRSAADPAVAALDGVTVANGSRQDATLRGTVDDHVAQRNIGRARRSLDSRTRGRRADRDRARPYSDPRIAAPACGKRARAQPETGGAG